MELTDAAIQRIEQAVREGVKDALREVFAPAVQQAAAAPAPMPTPLTGVCQHAKAQRQTMFGGKVQCYCPDCHAQWTE